MLILRRYWHKKNKLDPAVENKKISQKLLELTAVTPAVCLKKLKTTKKGLSPFEVHRRLLFYGKNEIPKEKKRNCVEILLRNTWDPLSVLLIVLAIIAFITSDFKAFGVILTIVSVSIAIRFFQELRSNKAAEKLRSLVHTTACAIRNGKAHNITFDKLVPGDIIELSAGDMIPADVKLLSSKDLFVNQSTLTGESIPAEKHVKCLGANCNELFTSETICFLGTNVASGTATAVVIGTGAHTYLGTLAESLVAKEEPTTFDLGVKKFTWLIMKITLVMVPLVFILNGLGKGNWFDAFLFAMAVAVGLTPEMLPMIIAVNLSKGAIDMSKKKVIVKKLNSIQNIGAMDILCSDKTGTLTEGKVVLERYLDIEGKENLEVLKYAYLNSFFQTGLKNMLDIAVLKHKEWSKKLNIKKDFKKIDEIPFDFNRRRMSVIVEENGDKHTLICKGAVEEILAKCTHAQLSGNHVPMREISTVEKELIEKNLNNEGFRVIAVAIKPVPDRKTRYSTTDENDLILIGFLAFLDPPKESARLTIKALERFGVGIKILTGDNELVTEKICSQVGLSAKQIILGENIEHATDEEMLKIVESNNIFAKLTPRHKERIIQALNKNGHTVGFMGDGINDAPALKAADVGISVDSAVDVAKESSDVILLERDLSVVRAGVLEGRKIFGNVIKYIEMSASSSFGNMFSVLGASIFLPFLPMLPIQILVNNLLYDFSQTAIPSDNVDEEYLKKPKTWNVRHLEKYIFIMGPVSTIFDYATFFVLLYFFNAWVNPALFQTGWFIESLISQTLIIHVIRTKKIPFLQSKPSKYLLLSTLIITAIGIYLPFSPVGSALGFVHLPVLYWPIIIALVLCYFALAQVAKKWAYKTY